MCFYFILLYIRKAITSQTNAKSVRIEIKTLEETNAKSEKNFSRNKNTHYKDKNKFTW